MISCRFNTIRSKGAHDYGQFVREARNAGYDEVATFFEQVMKEDSKRAAKCHAFMRELPGKEDVAQAADADAGRSSRPRPVIFWPVLGDSVCAPT